LSHAAKRGKRSGCRLKQSITRPYTRKSLVYSTDFKGDVHSLWTTKRWVESIDLTVAQLGLSAYCFEEVRTTVWRQDAKTCMGQREILRRVQVRGVWLANFKSNDEVEGQERERGDCGGRGTIRSAFVQRLPSEAKAQEIAVACFTAAVPRLAQANETQAATKRRQDPIRLSTRRSALDGAQRENHTE